MSLSSSARRILCMAGGRRIPIRGSIRSLSPTEGKFRVKGNGTQSAVRGAISVPECASNQSRPAFSWSWIRSSRFEDLFAWQNDCDYRQCKLIKAPFFLAVMTAPEQWIPGTAPDDDPV